MKLVFVSNFYNHHQKYVSEALYQLTGGNYWFVATTEVPEGRKKLGYREEIQDFVIQYYESEEIKKKTQELINNADVVIVGSAPEKLLAERKKARKPIIRYSERPLKKGKQLWKYPLRWYRFHRDNPRGVPLYMLCASAYTSYDYAQFGLFKHRAFKWGYFPEAKQHDVSTLLAGKKRNKLLWCGRFLDWKHPDDAIILAHRLKESGYDFELNFIGTGEMESKLRRMVAELKLEECVHFLGSMPPEQVRKHMEETGIYLFTSDKKEGWGAVLNEAMNSGCAVVASRAAGSSPYLINDGENGIIYTPTSIDELYAATKKLLDDHMLQSQLGTRAYDTILGEWNAKVAAERVLRLSECIINGTELSTLYKTGPCSVATVQKG